MDAILNQLFGFFSFLLLTVLIIGTPFFLVFLLFHIFIFIKQEDGTGALVLKGKYEKTILFKRGWRVNVEGTVELGEENLSWIDKIAGWLGYKYMGIRGIHKVFSKKDFVWIKSKSKGVMEKKGPEEARLLLVRFYNYGVEIEKAEDKNSLPLYIAISVSAMIVNLKKAWLDTDDWFSALTAVIEEAVTEYIGQNEFKVITKSGLSTAVFAALRTKLADLERLHGIRVDGMKCVKIDPPEDYRRATLKPWEAEQEADAAQKLAAKKAQDSMGVLVQMYKLASTETDLARRAALEAKADRLVEQIIALDKNALMRVEGGGMIDAAIAAWLKGHMGGTQEGSGGNP